jgi:hypothetical protein
MNYQETNTGKAVKTGEWVDKPLPKVGQGVDHRDHLLSQRASSTIELLHLTGEELTKQVQLKGNTDISWGYQ